MHRRRQGHPPPWSPAPPLCGEVGLGCRPPSSLTRARAPPPPGGWAGGAVYCMAFLWEASKAWKNKQKLKKGFRKASAATLQKSETIPWGGDPYKRFPKEGRVFRVSQYVVSNKTYISKCFAIKDRRQQIGFVSTRLLLCERMVKAQQHVAKGAPRFNENSKRGGGSRTVSFVCVWVSFGGRPGFYLVIHVGARAVMETSHSVSGFPKKL